MNEFYYEWLSQMLNNVVLIFFVLLLGSQHAFSAFQHKLEGSSGMASKESEQQHKDQDTDRYFGRYSYYIDPVEAYTKLLAESAFFFPRRLFVY